jgi:hypothetical protein
VHAVADVGVAVRFEAEAEVHGRVIDEVVREGGRARAQLLSRQGLQDLPVGPVVARLDSEQVARVGEVELGVVANMAAGVLTQVDRAESAQTKNASNSLK